MESIYPSQEAKLRAENIFKEIDFNNDGSINFSEFLTVNIQKEKLLNEETLDRAFKMFDLDGNGYITIDELKQAMPLEITTKAGWRKLVSEVDKDGDYQISSQEFKNMMVKLINQWHIYYNHKKTFFYNNRDIIGKNRFLYLIVFFNVWVMSYCLLLYLRISTYYDFFKFFVVSEKVKLCEKYLW